MHARRQGLRNPSLVTTPGHSIILVLMLSVILVVGNRFLNIVSQSREEGARPETHPVGDAGWLSWLDANTQRLGSYHDNKEATAWAATALFVPGILALSHFATEKPLNNELAPYLLGTVILLFLALAVLFVATQFDARRMTDREIRAMTQLWAEGTADGGLRDEWSRSTRGESPIAELWPGFVRSRITQISGQKCPAPRLRRLERVSYFTLAFSAFLAVIWTFVRVGKLPTTLPSSAYFLLLALILVIGVVVAAVVFVREP